MMIKRHLYLFFAMFWFGCTPTDTPDPMDIISQEAMLVTPAKTIIMPSKDLPKGWVLNREPMAFWGESLPSILGIAPDTSTSAEYWEESIEVRSGFKVPVKKAKVSYQSKTRVTVEVVELNFINVDNIYSITNYEPSHYELNEILKTIEIVNTGFPQLTSDDVLKHKVLMEYGTPDNFDGTWHHFQDKNTKMSVRIIDDKHLAVQLQSRIVEKRLKQALREVYSEEGIEAKKQQLLEGFGL